MGCVGVRLKIIATAVEEKKSRGLKTVTYFCSASTTPSRRAHGEEVPNSDFRKEQRRDSPDSEQEWVTCFAISFLFPCFMFVTPPAIYIRSRDTGYQHHHSCRSIQHRRANNFTTSIQQFAPSEQ